MARSKGRTRRRAQVEKLGASLDALRRSVVEDAPRPQLRPLDELVPGLARARALQLARRAPLTMAQRVMTPAPRQVSLDATRDATVRALTLAAGRPIGRRTRQKLEGRIPEVIRETICKPTRKRREVMFATGAAGKGKKAAARKRPGTGRGAKCSAP